MLVRIAEHARRPSATTRGPGDAPTISISTLPTAIDASSASGTLACASSRGLRARHQPRRARRARRRPAARAAALADDPAAQHARRSGDTARAARRDPPRSRARPRPPLAAARNRSWIRATAPRSTPRVGCAATTARRRGRDSSRAITTFCWLPPDSARTIASGSGGPDVERRDLRLARTRARGSRSIRNRPVTSRRPSARLSATVASSTSPPCCRSSGMCASPAASRRAAATRVTSRCADPHAPAVRSRAPRSPVRARAGRCRRRRRRRRSRRRAPSSVISVQRLATTAAAPRRPPRRVASLRTARTRMPSTAPTGSSVGSTRATLTLSSASATGASPRRCRDARRRRQLGADHRARDRARVSTARRLPNVATVCAGAQHGHLVGDRAHLVELVGDQHDRRALAPRAVRSVASRPSTSTGASTAVGSSRISSFAP